MGRLHVSLHLICVSVCVFHVSVCVCMCFCVVGATLTSVVCPNIKFYCFFDPYKYHMGLCSESCSSSWPAMLHGKKLKVGHHRQIVQPSFYVLCYTYRHHWLLPFYSTLIYLDLPWGSQGQRKAKPVVFLFSFTYPLTLINRFDFQTLYSDRYFVLNILIDLDLGLIDLDLDSVSKECDRAKLFTPTISQSFQWIWMEFGVLLRLVCVMSHMLILSHPFNIQGENPTYAILLNKTLNIGLYSDI